MAVGGMFKSSIRCGVLKSVFVNAAFIFPYALIRILLYYDSWLLILNVVFILFDLRSLQDGVTTAICLAFTAIFSLPPGICNSNRIFDCDECSFEFTIGECGDWRCED